MKFSKLVAASLLAVASVPAMAQSDVGLKVGATVYGPEAKEVGKIIEMGEGYVIVDTGTHRATINPGSFGKGVKGPLFGMTKAALDASIEKAEAENAAKVAGILVPDAKLYSSDGVEVGSVTSVGADGNVAVKYKTIAVAFPRDQFTANADGKLALVYSADQLNSALGAQVQAAAEKAAALQTALVVGAAVQSSDGIEVGTVREFDANGNVVIDHAASAFTLPRNQFTVNAAGGLALVFTKAQLDTALGG